MKEAIQEKDENKKTGENKMKAKKSTQKKETEKSAKLKSRKDRIIQRSKNELERDRSSLFFLQPLFCL